MRRILLAGAGLFTAIAAPLAVNAQPDSSTVTTADGRTYTLTPIQQDVFNRWTADQRTEYEGWPYDTKGYYWTLSPEQATNWWALDSNQRLRLYGWTEEHRNYYWTLSPEQQTGYWALTDEQRDQIVRMTPEQRTQAWASIAAQIAGAPPATSGVIQQQGNPVGSAQPPTMTPPNPQSANSAVPPAMPADPDYNAGPYKGALTAPPAEAMNKDYPVCTRTRQDSCRNPGGK